MNSIHRLRNYGLRPTRQRIMIADILLNGPNRHFNAEALLNDIEKSGGHMALATIYNCLNNFKTVGLIKQIETQGETAVFDTNVKPHHHFLNEENGELIDIDPVELKLKKLPKTPDGYEIKGFEVIVRLQKST